MPRPRPPFLHKETTRHGSTSWYVRKGKGPRIRIKGDYGSPEFATAYAAAISASEASTPAGQVKPANGTIMWAIGLYRHSTTWANLSSATRKQRGCILRKIEKGPAGSTRLLKDVTPSTIKASVGRLGPAAGRHFVATMRGFFKWAISEDLASIDPTAAIAVKQKKTDGHLPWSDADCDAYEARWPLGTRERVAFDVLYYTGLRRGDAVVVGKPHVRDGVIRIKTEKTGEWVAIKICPELACSIAAGPCGDLTFIAGERGRPRVKESFGEWFREACHAAGVTKTAHGLRKAAATRAANNGATEAQLNAMFGWVGHRMASHYTKSANREALAIGAGSKLSRGKPRTAIPAPSGIDARTFEEVQQDQRLGR